MLGEITDLAWWLAEMERRFANVSFVGEIVETKYDDREKPRVKVRYSFKSQDGKTGEEANTTWIPIPAQGATKGENKINTWAGLCVGDQVMCVAPGGDLENSIILGSIHSKKNQAPNTKAGERDILIGKHHENWRDGVNTKRVSQELIQKEDGSLEDTKDDDLFHKIDKDKVETIAGKNITGVYDRKNKNITDKIIPEENQSNPLASVPGLGGLGAGNLAQLANQLQGLMGGGGLGAVLSGGGLGGMLSGQLGGMLSPQMLAQAASALSTMLGNGQLAGLMKSREAKAMIHQIDEKKISALAGKVATAILDRENKTIKHTVKEDEDSQTEVSVFMETKKITSKAGDSVKITLDKDGDKVEVEAGSKITHKAAQIENQGDTTVSETLTVSKTTILQQVLQVGGIASLFGGLSTGALEVAKDEDGGLVEAEFGFRAGGGSFTVQPLLDGGRCAVANGLDVSTGGDADHGIEAGAFRHVAARKALIGPATGSASPTFRELTVDDLPDFSTLGNYADDAAAATGGVGVGKLYRNGSVVMVRVA